MSASCIPGMLVKSSRKSSSCAKTFCEAGFGVGLFAVRFNTGEGLIAVKLKFGVGLFAVNLKTGRDSLLTCAARLVLA